MKKLLIILFSFNFLVFYCQVGLTKAVWQEGFEYSTTCPEVLPGTTYGTIPQTYSPHGGSYHLYLNIIDNLPPMTVIYEKQISTCSSPQTYDLSLWVKDTWGGAYSVTFRIYDGATLIVEDEVASANVGTAYYNYTKQFTISSGSMTIQMLNTWTGGTGNYDIALDDILMTVDNYSDETETIVCDNTSLNLFDLVSSEFSQNGVWAGPSVLSNGYQGTFSGGNTEGDYYYNILTSSSCPDSSYRVSVKANMNELNLGNDTTICGEFSYVLDAGAGFDSYLWQDGSTGQTYTATSYGTYSVTTTSDLSGDNIIINGDFEQGDMGFSTSYVKGTGGTWGTLSNAGTYAITTNSSLVHNNFYSCTDHTTGSGKMMVVNGADVANVSVWCQTVATTPNTDYEFSAWVMSVENTSNPAELQFSINGTVLGSIFSPTSIGCDWNNFFEPWNSGATTSANICIVNQNTTEGGNDFALDDITFKPYLPQVSGTCQYSDEILISEYCELDVSETQPDCDVNYGTITINAPVGTEFEYSIDGGLTWSMSNIFTNLNNGNYQVTVRDINTGYETSNQNFTINLPPTNPIISLVSTTDVNCYGESTGAAEINITDGQPGYTIVWSPNVGSTESVSNISSGEYSVMVSDINGCSDTLKININQSDQIIFNSTFNNLICGYGFGSIINTPSGGNPNYTYEWLPNVSNDSVAQNLTKGDYQITITDALGCTKDTIITIDSIALDIQIFPIESYIIEHDSVQLTVTEGYSYEWSPNYNLSCVDCFNPFASPDTSTLYSVIVTDEFGCSQLLSTYIEVEELCGDDVFIPDIFSPNGDNINDFVCVYGRCVEYFTLIIYNRWGEEIFLSNDKDYCWDGTFKGKDMPNGSYVFQLNAILIDKTKISLTGNINLIR